MIGSLRLPRRQQDFITGFLSIIEVRAKYLRHTYPLLKTNLDKFESGRRQTDIPASECDVITLRDPNSLSKSGQSEVHARWI